MQKDQVDLKTIVMSAILLVGLWAAKDAYFTAVTQATPSAHTVEATRLRMEFRGNEAAAYSKYNGKIIEVTGKAHTVSMVGSAPVLSVGVMFTNVDCHLNPSMTESVGRMAGGSMVRVKGEAHAVGSDVFLKPCILL